MRLDGFIQTCTNLGLLGHPLDCRLLFEPAPGISVSLDFLSSGKSYANFHFISKICDPKEYKKRKKINFRFNTVCREHFKFKVLSANRVKSEMKIFTLFVLLRGHKFSK